MDSEMAHLARVLSDLDGDVLRPLGALCARMAQRQADEGRERLGDFWHALAALLDEEGLRRGREVQALEDALDDGAAVGELVGDATGLSDEESGRMAEDYLRDRYPEDAPE